MQGGEDIGQEEEEDVGQKEDAEEEDEVEKCENPYEELQ